MDVTDIPSATVHSDSDENRHEKPQTSQGLHSQYASEYCNNPLAKREVQTARPCAIIGPDRIVQQQPKRHSVLWPPTQDDTPYYSVPQSYHHYPAEHLYPPRNISPRQTFQENMPRILVPSGSSSKVTSEVASQVTAPGSFSDDGNVYIPKHFNPSLPQPKYCDVPYIVNPVNEHRPHAAKIGDIYVTKSDTIPSMMAPLPPHPNVSARTWQQVPVPQYQGNYPAPSLHRYAEYQQCPPPMYRPVKQGYKKINDDSSPTYISEGVYRNSDLRFQPYPTVKDKYSPARYDHPYNISNQFPTNYNTSQRGDYPKTVLRQPVQYPSHLHNRAMDPSADCLHKVPASRHPSQTTHHSVPYQMNENTTFKHIPGEHMYPVQSKVYGYSGDCSSRYINGVKGFENSKIYLDYNQRVKNIAYGDPFVSDPTLATYHKTQTPLYNYPVVNTNGQRSFPPFNVNYKMYETLGNPRHLPEYNIPYKTPDLRQNTYNPLARIPAQFSPNIISPTDSNTSVESTQQVTQEDCGYVSQCSTTSGKSVEYPHKFYSNCDRKGNRLMDSKVLVPPAFYNMSPSNRPTLDYSHEHLYHTNHTSTEQNKQSKQVRDLRQFLQMYNPHDEFEEATPNQQPSSCDKPKVDNLVSGNFTTANSGQNQLYVLDLVNVSSEELQKYEHIQKVNKLPDNIKGYNNVELLNQFEEALGTSESRENFEADKLPNISAVTDNKGINIISHNTLNYNCTRPISPLDVEAKISQSIIHKEVGCNFEIKPCSPVQNPTLPTLPIESKFEDVSGSDIFDNIHHPKDTTPEECSPMHVDTKSKLREKRRAKIGNTHAPSKRPKIAPLHDYDLNEGVVLNPHKSNDSEQDKPECLSSLPQLDSDIDIARNLTTQNKNDLLADCNGATYLESHTRIQYNDGQFNPNSLIYANTNKNEHFDSKEIIRPPLVYVANNSPIASPLNSSKIEEKNSSKLSKYRKVKKIDSPLPEMPITSCTTIDYCSNSPLNLELASEIRENNVRSNEVLVNLNSSEFRLHGSVNSVINSITDGKIESVTYSHTNNRFNENLHNKNHKSFKNIESLNSASVERSEHCQTLLESPSSQMKKLDNFSEEPHSLKKISSCNIAEQFNSNIQDIDVKLCSIQLKDNNNFKSSDYESKSSIDAFDNPFICQSNIDTQFPEKNITKDEEIKNDAIQKTSKVSKGETESTSKDIQNIVIENNIIKNGLKKEDNKNVIKMENMLQKNNCEASLIGEYNGKSTPNTTELSTFLDLSANQEISQPEEQDLMKVKYNPPETHKIDKTINSVSLESMDEISKKILSKDTHSKNYLDLKNLKATADIESINLIEVSEIEINSISETGETFIPNSTEPFPVVNSLTNLKISESKEHFLDNSKDDTNDDKNIEKSIFSKKQHSEDCNTSEDNESNTFMKVAETEINSACKTDDTHLMESEKLRNLLDVDQEITRFEEKDLNISENIPNNSDIENNHHGAVVQSTDTILKNEKLSSVDLHTLMEVADTVINSVCETDKTLLPISQTLTPLLDLSVHREIIYSGEKDLDVTTDNHDNSHNIVKKIISEESPHKVEGLSKCTTEKLLSTGSESYLTLGNSNSAEIEGNALRHDEDTERNSLCKTDNLLPPKSKKQSNILDSSDNHEISHFMDNMLDISKDNSDNNISIEKTFFSKEIHYGIVVPSKSMTDKCEESLNMESECKNISPPEELNISPPEELNISEVFESKTQMEIADPDMNSVCKTDKSLSPKFQTLTPVLDLSVHQEIIHSKQKDLDISKNNHNIVKNVISDESHYKVEGLLKSMTLTTENLLSTQSGAESSMSLENLNSSDIKKWDVVDAEMNSLCHTDNMLLPKSEKESIILDSSVNHEDNPENDIFFEKSMISKEICSGIGVTLKSMTDKFEESLNMEPECKKISSPERLNISELFESNTLIGVENTDMNSVCETGDSLSSKSEELSSLSSSPVNQEILYSKQKDLDISKEYPNHSCNIDETIISKELDHGVVVSFESKTETNEKSLSTKLVCTNTLGLDDLKSTDIESDTQILVTDTEVHCVSEKDHNFLQKSTVLVAVPVNQAMSYFNENEGIDFSEDRAENDDKNIDITTISNEISDRSLKTWKSMSDESKKSYLEKPNVSEDVEKSTLENTHTDINSICRTDYKFSLKSKELTISDSTGDQEISYSEQKESENISNDCDNKYKTVPSEENDYVFEVCLKHMSHMNNSDINQMKVFEKSEDIENNTLADSEINYVYETDRKCSDSEPRSPSIHKSNSKHIVNNVDNIVFTRSTEDIAESLEDSSSSFAVISDEIKYASDATSIFNSTVKKLLLIEQSEEKHGEKIIISNKITKPLLDYNSESQLKLTDGNNITKEHPKITHEYNVSGGSAKKLQSNKSVENNDCASEQNLVHNYSSVSKNLYSELDEQIDTKHSDATPMEGVENISCSISAPKLIKNNDSPMPGELDADKDESTPNPNDTSKKAMEVNRVPSLLENNDNSIFEELKYATTENPPIIVNVALKETVENNCEKNISFERTDTLISKYTSDSQDDCAKDTNISVKVSDTSEETIDCYSNCDSSNPDLVDKNIHLKCKEVNNDRGDEISVGINLTSCKSTNNENCDEIQAQESEQKKTSPISSKSTFVNSENERGESNNRNTTSKETVATNNCNSLLPVLFENYDLSISNEFDNVKDEMIEVRVNLTSNETTKKTSFNHSNVVVEKNNSTTLIDLNYDEGQNIEVSKVYTECNNHNSNNREVENRNTPKLLDDEVADNVHVKKNFTSEETSENTECTPAPVLVENYDSPMSKPINYDKFQEDFCEIENTSIDKVRSEQTLVEEKNSQITKKLSSNDVEHIPFGINVISNEISESIFFNTELVLVENYDSPKSNYETDVNESMQSNNMASKEMIENINCGIKEQIDRSPSSNCERYNSNSIKISDNTTSNTNDVQLNLGENKNLKDGNNEMETAENYAMVLVHPAEEEVMNNSINVEEVNNAILEEANNYTQIQDGNSSSEFCFENNKYDVNHTDHIILAENLNNDLQFLEVGTKPIKTHNEDLPPHRDASMFLGYDCEDFMRAGVITVKDEQCCVVLERNGKIYSERGNSIEDVLCNMIPCSPLSDSDEHTQDYELVTCESYDNIPDVGVTESIDNFSGVDIQISSSEGDENANNITLTHKVALLQEASMCESDSESSQFNADSRDPCLQGVDDSPVLLELPTVMNENNFGESSNFENTNIGIQYEDCWINDVACIETVVSEDVSDLTQNESSDYDECSNDSKEQENELHSINHKQSSISIADVVEKEVKSLYVRIKLVSQIETENFDDKDSCPIIKERRSIISDHSSGKVDVTDEIQEEIPVKENCVSIERDNKVLNVRNHTPDKQKSLMISKHSSSYKVDEDRIDISVKNNDKALNNNNFTSKSSHTPAAKGRVVSNVSYNYNTDTTNGGSKLITKAAKKYIPPIVDSQHNFKVQLPLSKENLLRLKIMKLKFDEATAKPKMRWQASFSQAASTSLSKTPKNTTIPKKSKPKFEDVLKKIDHIQINSLSKSKSKKDDLDPSVPKVIIKKNEYGSHYTANIKKRRARSPDLTGRRWQPWVHLERNRLVEKMVSKNKFRAVFCHSSNKYIIPRRARQENKDNCRDPEIVVSRPLKCTIKLNTDNGLGHAVLAPAHVSAHTSHSSLHHSKPILTISNYKKKYKKE